MEDGLDLGPLTAQVFQKVTGKCFVVVLGDDRFTDRILVRHHDRNEVSFLKAPNRLGGSGEELQTLDRWPFVVGMLLHKSAIAIEKRCPHGSIVGAAGLRVTQETPEGTLG